jgi:uncharacterized protein with von Willebrand factor type A (vWA) domain
VPRSPAHREGCPRIACRGQGQAWRAAEDRTSSSQLRLRARREATHETHLSTLGDGEVAGHVLLGSVAPANDIDLVRLRERDIAQRRAEAGHHNDAVGGAYDRRIRELKSGRPGVDVVRVESTRNDAAIDLDKSLRTRYPAKERGLEGPLDQ